MTDPAPHIKSRESSLNKAQGNAVEAMLDGWDGGSHGFIFPLVEGPPGTGKTTVGVLGAARFIREKPRAQVAYVAFTNFAAERARASFYDLGFTPREVIRLTPEQSNKDWSNGVVSCRSDLEGLTPQEKRQIRDAQVLITTIQSSSRIFNTFHRPFIIVDEYSQVSPPMFFYLLSKVSRTGDYNPAGYALLGDPNQLPVITTQPLLRPNIGNFLLARKRDLDSHELMLQYRMHPKICEAVNAFREALRTYELVNAPGVAGRDLTKLGYTFDSAAVKGPLREVLAPSNPFVMIDTDGLPGEEFAGMDQSKCYDTEARLAAQLATAMRAAYSKKEGGHLVPTTLSPYKGQVGQIKDHLRTKDLRDSCFTVYKSQGREYPAVIVSFVRKNDQGNIGFLGEAELNAQPYVACSRAQGKLIILFSFRTFQGNPDFALLLERCRASALVVDGSDLMSS